MVAFDYRFLPLAEILGHLAEKLARKSERNIVDHLREHDSVTISWGPFNTVLIESQLWMFK